MKHFVLLMALLWIVPLAIVAHTAPEDPMAAHHEQEDVAKVNPLYALGGIGVVAAGGFAVWWFALRKK